MRRKLTNTLHRVNGNMQDGIMVEENVKFVANAQPQVYGFVKDVSGENPKLNFRNG
jgi:hypothetical protein